MVVTHIFKKVGAEGGGKEMLLETVLVPSAYPSPKFSMGGGGRAVCFGNILIFLCQILGHFPVLQL